MRPRPTPKSNQFPDCRVHPATLSLRPAAVKRLIPIGNSDHLHGGWDYVITVAVAVSSARRAGRFCARRVPGLPET